MPGVVPILLRLHPDDARLVSEITRMTGSSQSDVIRRAIRHYHEHGVWTPPADDARARAVRERRNLRAITQIDGEVDHGQTA